MSKGLPALPYSNPLAVQRDLACRTVRADRLAEILSVGDQQIVKNNPILRREFSTQRHLRFLRRSRSDIPQPIRYSVHMRIHRDPGFLKTQRDNDVRGFTPNSGQVQQGIQV